MTDFLHTKLAPGEIFETGALALAHVGDAVYELMIRAYLCKQGTRSVKNLHKKTVAWVSANAQARAAEKIMEFLTEEEKDVYLRGRNTKVNSVPKGAELANYHAATGFESLFGWLYLKGEYDRINILFSHITDENGFSE